MEPEDLKTSLENIAARLGTGLIGEEVALMALRELITAREAQRARAERAKRQAVEKALEDVWRRRWGKPRGSFDDDD